MSERIDVKACDHEGRVSHQGQRHLRKRRPLLSAAGAKLVGQPSNTQVAALVRGTYVPSIQTQITDIRALGVPAGERAAVSSMLSLAQADLRKLQSNPTLVATDVFADFAKVARPYGLTACAPTS